MEIRDYKAGDENKIIPLFEMVFKRPMSLEQWRWRFEENPAGKYMIKLMWDGDTLAGHYAVSPVFMIYNGEKILTTLSLTTMTHPDYGRRGIFGDLANSLYNTLEQDLNVKAIWGFPNNNSHYGFIKNLGWKDVGVIHTLTLKANKLSPLLNENTHLVSDLNFSHAELLEHYGRKFPVSIDRNLEYLNWRYLKKPSSKYYFIEHNSDGVKSFIIFKFYKSNESPETWEINILEIAVADSTVLKFLLQHILAEFSDKNIVNISLWMSLFEPMHLQLEKMGFIPEGKQTYLGIRADEIKFPEVHDLRKWHYSMGDSDVY